MLGQLRQKTQLRRLAQAFGRGAALSAHLQRARAGCCIGGQHLQAAFELHRPAQRLGMYVFQAKAAVAELHHAARAGQCRRVGRHAHVAVAQRDAAAHGGFMQLVNRQAQVELQLGRAAAAGLRQSVVDQAVNRRFFNDIQKFAQRPTGLGGDFDHRVFEVGNLRLCLADADRARTGKLAAGADDLHRRALKHQLAAQASQRWPGQFTGGLHAGRHKGVGGVLHLRGNAKFALLGVVERQVVQVAFDAKCHGAGAAGQHTIAHVVARFGGNYQRQVAVHARAIGAGQRAVQFQYAGKACAAAGFFRVAGAPCGAQLALGVGVGKVGLADLHADAWIFCAVNLPMHLGVELAQRQHRVFKNTGQ